MTQKGDVIFRCHDRIYPDSICAQTPRKKNSHYSATRKLHDKSIERSLLQQAMLVSYVTRAILVGKCFPQAPLFSSCGIGCASYGSLEYESVTDSFYCLRFVFHFFVMKVTLDAFMNS